MTEHNVQKLEELAAHINNLLDKSAMKIYLANRRQSLPRIAGEIQGLFGEDQPIIVFRSGDSNLDTLFYDLINPENITGKIRRGRREYECNLIWEDICRNGLGVNQYERISQEARRLTLRKLEKEDKTGEKAFSYLENKALDPTQRQRARRDWVGFLSSYAHCERLTRDPAYVQYHEEFMRGEKIDVEAVKSRLPNSATPERLYLAAERIMNHEIEKAAQNEDFSDYYVRLDLIGVFDKVGTSETLQKVRERLNDPKEHGFIKKEAARVLEEK